MFKVLKQEVQDSFKKLAGESTNLFLTNVDRDLLWETYLNSFEDPTERQEHNCNCCRQFIKNYGNIVGVVDGKMVSIWNFETKATDFTSTVKEMNRIALSGKIVNRVVLETHKLGTNTSKQQTETGVIQWDHFYVEAPKELVCSRSTTIDTALSIHRDLQQVFYRALTEISIDSVETVLELIAQNSLYKGVEYKDMLTNFLKAKREFDASTDKHTYSWIKSGEVHPSVSKIRNTSIGTLLVDLTEGKELDYAVTAFERMVAPTNYKRPTALVTKRMYDDAEKTITELGYMDSLGRRFATPEDISVDNVIYVNRDTKQAMGVFDQLREDIEVNPKTFSKVEEVTIDKFLSDVVPTAKSIEVLVENNHLNNLVSLIAPIDETAPSLFKWNNPFSWSYVNNLTDSMKELVKAAGGKVDGVLRYSIQWNEDGKSICDLDAHAIEPNGFEIYYGNKGRRTSLSGMLDVDMIRPSKIGVENITWSNTNSMIEGVYKMVIHNYDAGRNTGFQAEIEFNGEVHNFSYNKPFTGKIVVAEVTYSRTKGFSIKPVLESNSSIVSKEKWGLKTNKFQKVSMILNSPNHWNTNVGNKHTFFILEGTKNNEEARGFFNEFLHQDLEKNRRVFEVLGSKLKVEPADKQLSGVGFSSTQRNSVVCRVKGKTERLIKVTI